ncbi:MAG: HEAT repeat domain-containing protein [Deltaproteobacteria bacterium]|nr:HEAT repeat domain-containing protein [Deltaproteobacteria bacterium]MDQ3300830.1 HEAT repeat domain-containing protein [Myxococcota bacterium]
MATITLVMVALTTSAHANQVEQLIGQLDDSSDKVRLGAALNLTKLGDPKAIPALAKRINIDTESSKNVRSASAVGLGKLASGKISASLKKLAVSALQNAQANDPSEFVKVQAEKALEAIGATAGPATPSGGGGAIYVNVGPMSSKTGSNDAKFRGMMVSVSAKTLSKVASNMQQTWPGGKLPDKSALAAKGYQGFYVDGTLNELKIDTSGSSSTISCKVSMLLASFPDKSVFGFLNGGAKVQASASQRDIDLASEDCVSAVIEDLIAKKIVPTIKSKAGP